MRSERFICALQTFLAFATSTLSHRPYHTLAVLAYLYLPKKLRRAHTLLKMGQEMSTQEPTLYKRSTIRDTIAAMITRL